ncbi:major tail protein [Clostridium sp. K25]|uniref:major tail protein n=1 Tax=Clostridium sp. K25 TaxID=1443109 RepID=UPI0006526E0E|nr:major tail protein [Clostridium sp. K25]
MGKEEQNTATEVMPVVGLECLYVAEILKDTREVLEFGKPQYFAGIKEIGIKPKVTSDEFYAENKLWVSETTLASIDVELDITDLLEKDEAFLLGHQIDKKGGVLYSDNDKAREVALLFKANKGNGKARYVILYKGTFAISDESYKGKEGKANFQAKKLKATFGTLHNNGAWKYKIDEENGMTDKEFFKEVYVPTAQELKEALEEAKKAKEKLQSEGSH